MAPLRIWWTKKYQRSPQSDEFLGYTLFELVTEFFEDYFAQNPDERFKYNERFETGDPIIDNWEKELAAGKIPDLTDGLTETQREKMIAWSIRETEKRKYSIQSAQEVNSQVESELTEDDIEEFNDTY